jgi:collagenase-like PrtC family protease
MKQIELMSPAGGIVNLKAAISSGADSVYFGLTKFNARQLASNIEEKNLGLVVKMCRSNNVKTRLTMNTLVKNSEIPQWFRQLESAYSKGIDAVIIQETSFIPYIRKSFPDLKIHVSTQAGALNSLHARQLKADRINLARELSLDEIKTIRKHTNAELEVFVHGALCVCISGSCLFSSFLGGRSGNRGMCAQPCRKVYDGSHYLSTKDMSLIKRVPEIVDAGINSMKIEGRLRTPYYVATTTSVYRKAIDSYYAGNFEVSKDMMKQLFTAFNREFTEGGYAKEDVFRRSQADGFEQARRDMYDVKVDDLKKPVRKVNLTIPETTRKWATEPRLLVRVYNLQDAQDAEKAGADIVYMDIFDKDFVPAKKWLEIPVFGVTPRIFLDKDRELLLKAVRDKKPDGLLAGNMGVFSLGLKIPIHKDYNLNAFNDLDADEGFGIISPELSMKELKDFRNKNFAVFVHGKVRLMTLRHVFDKYKMKDECGYYFHINRVKNGSEILNDKELGLLTKTKELVKAGINNFYVDTDRNVAEVVQMYRDILDGNRVDDWKLAKKHVLGWAYKGVA